jgi:hypothetical protein
MELDEKMCRRREQHETAAHADSEILGSHVCIQYRGCILLPLLVQASHDWKRILFVHEKDQLQRHISQGPKTDQRGLIPKSRIDNEREQRVAHCSNSERAPQPSNM